MAFSVHGGSNGSINPTRSSSTVHGRVLTYDELLDHHASHAPPGRFNKIVLRALIGQQPRTGIRHAPALRLVL
ncbi:hypothetical protein E4K10_48895 [Streptomyces sp. T1317-0309]|nr:hypothetical protein E4K10_48895 [Streptomyces sp. T1317-0309]